MNRYPQLFADDDDSPARRDRHRSAARRAGHAAPPPPAPAHYSKAPVGGIAEALHGRLHDRAALVRFLEGGHAYFTIRSRASGTRLTLRAVRPDENEHRERQAQYGATSAAARPRPIWVSVLNGPENTSDYAFLGTLWPEPGGVYRYAHSPKSRAGLDAPSVRAVQWLARALSTADAGALFAQAEVWHEGRCGRCGRRLTVPESISSGFGPECAGRMS